MVEMPIDKYKLMEELARDEGKRNTMYYDSVGVPTIGIGHNLHEPLPDYIIEEIFKYDCDLHLQDCYKLPYWEDLSQTRKRVIANMMFNLGPSRFNRFKKMNAALEAGDFHLAAAEMEDSKWYKQVGNRAERLCQAMRWNDERYLREGLI